MPDATEPTPMRRVRREVEVFLVVAAYLSLVLLTLATYRSVVLQKAGISTFTFGFRLVEALVLAKVVLVGEWLHVGARFEGTPIAWRALYRSVVVGALVFAFTLVEHGVRRVLHHGGLLGPLARLEPWAWDEALASAVVVVAALIPMFFVDEVRRILGTERFLRLCFRDGAATDLRPGEPTAA